MDDRLWERMEALTEKKGKTFLSVTGGGGKTTFLVEFSSFLKSKGYSVLITTSTKLASPYCFSYNTDYTFLDSSIIHHYPRKGESTFFSFLDPTLGKAVSPREELVALIKARYDAVIVEADGSRNLPFKIHTERDPVIWKDTDSVIALCGMWGYGKRVRDVSFGDDGEGSVDARYLQEYLDGEEGLSKGMEGVDAIYLFNGAEDADKETREAFLSLRLPKGRRGFLVSEKEGVIYGSL